MDTERKLTEFILNTKYEDLPPEPLKIMRTVILTVLGTIVAGATDPAAEKALDQVKEWGGGKEATVLVHGVRAPAYNAAFVNGVMARALDFCDAIQPGMHVGSTAIPTGLASAELAGGCSGRDFLTAITIGTEVACRINAVSTYDGFDPTGICAVFASTAVAGRLLGLNADQMHNAMALAFNRSAGSFQCNVEGAQGVLLIQGFTAQNALMCAQLARRGLTGPKNFIEGTFGYFHLFAKDSRDTERVAGDLGKRFELSKILFKKYPSCGLTQSSTAVTLELVAEKGLAPEDIERIEVRVQPFVYNMVGHFELGNNPKVNAQYSIPYCIASALLRKSCILRHFDEPSVREPEIMYLVDKVQVTGDPELNSLQMCAIRMRVTTKDRKVYDKSMDIAPGFPGNPLTQEDHMARFRDCMSYASKPLPEENVEKLVDMVNNIEKVDDVRSLIPLLV
ncbi:MAG: MmgE/PrpD family protein [Dehalococcoidia bacterium]|nr:MmgE/PrpD family protein [Dehalococcoidia bacterium]